MDPVRVLFVPVSGPTGMGEYQNSLFLAQGLLARHPDWDARIVVSDKAPYADSVPIPSFRTADSPTLDPDGVDRILDGFRPGVVVFDCAGRRRSLARAAASGARTVFVANHARKRRRGFRLSRLRHTSEIWLMEPRFVAGGVGLSERLKLALLGKPDPVFLGPVFPEPVRPADAPEPPFFVCCPGGGGHHLGGRQSGEVFSEQAIRVAEATGTRGVVVTGGGYVGPLPEHPGIAFHRGLPGAELAGLLGAAAFALLGGGYVLAQAAALRVPSIAAPAASDQPARIAAYEREGLCLSALPAELADVAIEATRSGRLASIRGRLAASDLRNGLEVALDRLEALASRVGS